MESSIGHVNGQLFQDFRLLGVEIEAHLAKPFESLRMGDVGLDQSPSDGSLVDKFIDEVFQFPAAESRLFLKD